MEERTDGSALMYDGISLQVSASAKKKRASDLGIIQYVYNTHITLYDPSMWNLSN